MIISVLMAAILRPVRTFFLINHVAVTKVLAASFLKLFRNSSGVHDLYATTSVAMVARGVN